MARKPAATIYSELPGLFFETRQIIRQSLPGTEHSDPNEWVRLETMQFIAQRNPTMQEVAAYLRIKAPSATSLIGYLVENGMIERKSGTDRRYVRLFVTDRGRDVLKKYGRASERMMRQAFSTLHETEVCTLSNLLKKLISGHAARTQ